MKRALKFAMAILSVSLVFASCSKDDDEKSDAKQIKSFSFADPQAVGVINDSTKQITIVVPAETDVTELVPIINVSDKATVNPLSGIPQNFTKPVVFTVTAEDGSTTAYVVTVTVNGNGGNGGNGGDVTDITEAMKLSGSMDENKTLKDLGLPIDYIVDGMLTISGNACLTIEPGVTIAFTGTNGIVSVDENAGLKMVGTAEKPITFTGPVNNQNKGAWGYIEYHSNRADNQMEYVILKNGGSYDGYGVLNTFDAGSVSVKNCTIDGGLGFGVQTHWGNGKNFKAFENNTIKNVAKAPMDIDAWNANNIGSGNKFEENGENYIMMTNSINDNKELILNNVDIPYYFPNGFMVEGKSELTVNAGVKLVFGKNEGMYTNSETVVKFEGTEASPITLCGLESKAGYWKGVNHCSEEDECIFKNVVISDGDEFGLKLDCFDEVLKIENLTIKNIKEYGLIVRTGTKEEEVDGETVYSRVWSEAFPVGVSSLKFENCGKGNIYDNNTLDGETEGVDNVFESIPE